MSSHLAPLEAYRRDLVRAAYAPAPAPSRSQRFGEDDDGWLLVAHVVGRRAECGDVLGAPEATNGLTELRRLAASVAGASTLAEAQVAAIMSAAARMEAAGALLLAASTLGSLERLLGDGRPLERGRALAQLGRVERLLGELETAADVYRRVGRLGARARLPELHVRADLGLGVLARMRGNYPEARQRFRRALATAEREGLGELTGLAHQSLLVAAAVARDFDTALSHGWHALAHVAGDQAKEAELLVNLATLCLDAGQSEAALGAFLAAAERTARPAFRVAAQAGAAVAAALTGDRALLEECSASVERALLSGGLAPYEQAQRLLTLADAWRAAGDAEAEASALARGLAVARAHDFAELVLEYEGRHDRASGTSAPVQRRRGDPPVLGRDAHRVVRAMASLGESPTSGTGWASSERSTQGGEHGA